MFYFLDENKTVWKASSWSWKFSRLIFDYCEILAINFVSGFDSTWGMGNSTGRSDNSLMGSAWSNAPDTSSDGKHSNVSLLDSSWAPSTTSAAAPPSSNYDLDIKIFEPGKQWMVSDFICFDQVECIVFCYAFYINL